MSLVFFACVVFESYLDVGCRHSHRNSDVVYWIGEKSGILNIIKHSYTFIYTHTYIYIYINTYVYIHTHIYRVSRRNVPDFGRVFLMLKYTDITQNTYVQSWTVTEMMDGEFWNFDSCYILIYYQIRIKTGRNMWFL